MTHNLDAFLKGCENIADKILRHIEKGDLIQIVSHLDADGVAAGSIMAKAIHRLGGNFSLRVAKQVDERLIERMLQVKAKLYIFAEIGSGYLDLLTRIREAEVLVIDHHKPLEGSYPSIAMVNPHLYGIDGASEISGAGVCYIVAKKLSQENIDLSPLGVVGALGDLQDKNEKRSLTGLNQVIVEDAVDGGYLEVRTDLLFYGRETRPIYKAIASTMNPFIPGLSGEEGNSLGFLVNLGIPLKAGEKFRTLADLTAEEKQRIYSELTKYLSSKGFTSSLIISLIGSVYTLLKEDRLTPMRDGREFASLLNACARMDKPGVAVALCMGDRGEALNEAQNILSEYRKVISRYMGHLLGEARERIRDLENICIVDCEGIVDENLLSPVASILSTSGVLNQEKPLLFLTRTREGEVKVSARASETLVGRGLSVGTIMQTAAERVKGRGGGHSVAAGANIPHDQKDNFIRLVDQLAKSALLKSDVQS
ncbi:MAG: DHH family phosphoesterase [Candidatus Bathyarchaeia archaeon]